MPPKSRQQAKASPGTVTSAPKSIYPGPFGKPEPGIGPFLEYLDPDHVYITHIDRTDRLLKRNTFIQVVVLNLVILGLLAWRAYYIAPYYGALFLTFIGSESPLTIDTENTPWPMLLEAVVGRSGTLMLDFILLRFLGAWPYDFFLGKTSPSFWRSSVGFHPVEVIIRRSRNWDQHLPKDWLKEQEKGSGKEIFEERIMPAINKEYVRTKTGYLMMDKSWDLDIPATIMAAHLINTTKNSFRDFEKAVLVHVEPHGWLSWPVWKLDEGDPNDANRQKLMLFKDKLTRMGKESLFFRWIELIQFESSRPGGFTLERQKSAMEQAKKLFEEQGIDFEKFWEEVGGVEGLPGWD